MNAPEHAVRARQAPSSQSETPAPRSRTGLPLTTRTDLGRRTPAGYLTPGVRRRATDPLGDQPIPPQIHAVLRGRQGQGQPLPGPLADELGAGFGRDLSVLRVHTGSEAAALTRDLHAHAFAYGTDLYFSPGRYQPDSSTGRQMLAHEIAHTLQPEPDARGRVGRADDPAERQADALAAHALRRTSAGPFSRHRERPTGAPTVRRVHKFLRTALIGLELTFEDADSQRYVGNDGFPSGLGHAPSQWWDRLKEAWVEEIATHPWTAAPGRVYPVAPPEPGDGEQKDLGGGMDGETSLRLTYVVNGEPWWWQLSMDPGVIEIQTAPTLSADLMDPGSAVSRILQMHVFDISATANPPFGFAPGGGGGHLNVDLATGFGDSYRQVLQTVRQTEMVIANLRRGDVRLNVTREDLLDLGLPNSTGLADAFSALIDHDNESSDPFLTSQRMAMPTHHRSGDWTGELPQPRELFDPTDAKSLLASRNPGKSDDAWKVFLDDYAQWLYKHPTRAQYDKATAEAGSGESFPARLDGSRHARDSALHYQAVNLSHVLHEPRKDETAEETEEGHQGQRVEFRFFKGQTSLADLQNGLRLLTLIKRRAEQMK